MEVLTESMLIDTQGNFSTYHGWKHNKIDRKLRELRKEETKQVEIHRHRKKT